MEIFFLKVWLPYVYRTRDDTSETKEEVISTGLENRTVYPKGLEQGMMVRLSIIYIPFTDFNFRVGLLMDVNREGPCVPLQCVSNYRSAFTGGALAENALAYYQPACVERVLV